MQSVSSRIWTRVAVSISYDANHYTTGTSTTLLYDINNLYRIQIIFKLINLTDRYFHSRSEFIRREMLHFPERVLPPQRGIQMAYTDSALYLKSYENC